MQLFVAPRSLYSTRPAIRIDATLPAKRGGSTRARVLKLIVARFGHALLAIARRGSTRRTRFAFALFQGIPDGFAFLVASHTCLRCVNA